MPREIEDEGLAAVNASWDASPAADQVRPGLRCFISVQDLIRFERADVCCGSLSGVDGSAVARV